MSLHVMGAGLVRTGMASLKLALEQLLDGPCYRMSDVWANPEHIPVWHCAVRGQPLPWTAFFDGYRAAVDVPAAQFRVPELGTRVGLEWRALDGAGNGPVVTSGLPA
jgi:hypothetical protein